MNDDPVTGSPIIDTATRVFDWLGRQAEQFIPRPPEPPARAPSDMTDKQLHTATYHIGVLLQNGVALPAQRSFKSYGATMGDPRFPSHLPTTVRAHTLMMVTQATDSYALALLGLRDYATTSALGPIRNIAETYAYGKWLLESADEKARLGRAYRLTMDAIDQLRQLKRVLEKAAGPDNTSQLAPRLGASAGNMRRRLREIAKQDGVSIAPKPKRSELLERHLTGSGGYALYSLLSSAGVHPGAGRTYAFYGRPGTGITDFDFKGLHHVRAYWIAMSIRLHADLCDLVAPVLGWQEWDALAEETRTRLEPLAQEAERRYLGPVMQAVASAPTWADPPSRDAQS